MIHPWPSNSILASDAWLDFNTTTWGLKAERLNITADGKDLPALETVVYHDRRGRLRMPKLNPYLPVRFSTTPTKSRPRRASQWLTVCTLLARLLRERRIAGAIALPPEVCDVWPFQWDHFLVGLRYTCFRTLPFDPDESAPDVRAKVRKAAKLGHTTDRAWSADDIIACVRDTEERQGFRYGLEASDLVRAWKLLGDDRMRCYVAFAPNGEPVCASIVLHTPGEVALGWIEGIGRPHLNDGASQLVRQYMLGDLSQAGATGLDFMGTNLPSVAAAKRGWGAELAPYFTVQQPGVKTLLRRVESWWRFQQAR